MGQLDSCQLYLLNQRWQLAVWLAGSCGYSVSQSNISVHAEQDQLKPHDLNWACCWPELYRWSASRRKLHSLLRRGRLLIIVADSILNRNQFDDEWKQSFQLHLFRHGIIESSTDWTVYVSTLVWLKSASYQLQLHRYGSALRALGTSVQPDLKKHFFVRFR
jgi:hypothetical protein